MWLHRPQIETALNLVFIGGIAVGVIVEFVVNFWIGVALMSSAWALRVLGDLARGVVPKTRFASPLHPAERVSVWGQMPLGITNNLISAGILAMIAFVLGRCS
jgi:hypothetical protein